MFICIYIYISATVPLHWKAYGNKAPRSGHSATQTLHRLCSWSILFRVYSRVYSLEYTLYQPQVPQISKIPKNQWFFNDFRGKSQFYSARDPSSRTVGCTPPDTPLELQKLWKTIDFSMFLLSEANIALRCQKLAPRCSKMLNLAPKSSMFGSTWPQHGPT